MIEEIKSYLFKRRKAYLRLFDKNNPDVVLILQDLAKFCRAHESSFGPDDRTSALLEGRREVFLRIQQHLNLTEEELWSIYSRKG